MKALKISEGSWYEVARYGVHGMIYTQPIFANSSCSNREIEPVVRKEICSMKHMEDGTGGRMTELDTRVLKRERGQFLNKVVLPIVRNALAGSEVWEGWQFITILL